jgi:putative transposase
MLVNRLVNENGSEEVRLTHSWPHAPSKLVRGPGMYIVTAGTFEKKHLFDTAEKLDLLQAAMFRAALETGWSLQAWAFFINHYHIVGHAPKSRNPVRELTSLVHGRTAFDLNKLDDAAGRKVWYSCWDTKLTYEKSYLARLAYVHKNPVKHGLVRVASHYEWCSAGWFEQNGDQPFVRTVNSFKTDKVKVPDDFD